MENVMTNGFSELSVEETKSEQEITNFVDKFLKAIPDVLKIKLKAA